MQTWQTWRPNVRLLQWFAKYYCWVAFKVCYDVAIEPPLQPLTGEVIEPKTANLAANCTCQDEAIGPIFMQRDSGAAAKCQEFFSLIYKPTAIPVSLHSICDRIREVQQASFTSLVFMVLLKEWAERRRCFIAIAWHSRTLHGLDAVTLCICGISHYI